MASMLEGGGKTPILPPDRLAAMGFQLCAYPLSLLGVSVRAMQDALQVGRRGLGGGSHAHAAFRQGKLLRSYGTATLSRRAPTSPMLTWPGLTRPQAAWPR